MCRNLLVESEYSSLVSRHIGRPAHASAKEAGIRVCRGLLHFVQSASENDTGHHLNSVRLRVRRTVVSLTYGRVPSSTTNGSLSIGPWLRVSRSLRRSERSIRRVPTASSWFRMLGGLRTLLWRARLPTVLTVGLRSTCPPPMKLSEAYYPKASPGLICRQVGSRSVTGTPRSPICFSQPRQSGLNDEIAFH